MRTNNKRSGGEDENVRDAHRVLWIADITAAAGGGDETEWSKEKNKSVSISQQRLAADGVRLGCGAEGPSYRPVPELLTSLRSHGLGM